MAQYKLLPWVQKNQLWLPSLLDNPNAADYLKDEYGIADDTPLVDQKTIQLLERQLDNGYWSVLSKYSWAIGILEKNQDKIIWQNLMRNPAAVHLIETNQDKIVWRQLFYNTTIAVHFSHLIEENITRVILELNRGHRITINKYSLDLMRQYPQLINWQYLCMEPDAMDIILANPNKISWYGLSRNPAATGLLQNNVDKIDWIYAARNPNAISLIEQYIVSDFNWAAYARSGSTKTIHKIKWFDDLSSERKIEVIKNTERTFWSAISGMPHAIKFIEQNLDKIDWNHLSINTAATHLFGTNLSKTNHRQLSLNPAAIYILEANEHIIDYHYLSRNPAIFTCIQQPVKEIIDSMVSTDHPPQLNPESIQYTTTMASFDNPLVELRAAQMRAIAEFERIQLKEQARHASSCAIANNSEIHDIFSNVFDGPAFVPGAFDVKCALLFGPAVGHPTRFAGADATTFPARVVVSQYETHNEKPQSPSEKLSIKFEIDNYCNLFHVESGLYLIFNRAPFPVVAFRFLMFNSGQIFQNNYFGRNPYWGDSSRINFVNYSNITTESMFFKQVPSLVPQNAANVFAHLHKMRDALQTRVSVPPPIAAPQRATEYDAQHQQIMLMRTEIATLNETIATQQMKLDISATIIDKFKETQKILAGILPVDTN